MPQRQGQLGSFLVPRPARRQIGHDRLEAASRRVPAAMTTASGSARACSRAARFGVSPTTDCSFAEPSPIRSPNDHQPGGDADARLELEGLDIELTHGINDA